MQDETLTSPFVRWMSSAGYGLKHAFSGRYVELAPNRHLSGLMRKIEKSIRVENFNEPK